MEYSMNENIEDGWVDVIISEETEEKKEVEEKKDTNLFNDLELEKIRESCRKYIQERFIKPEINIDVENDFFKLTDIKNGQCYFGENFSNELFRNISRTNHVFFHNTEGSCHSEDYKKLEKANMLDKIVHNNKLYPFIISKEYDIVEEFSMGDNEQKELSYTIYIFKNNKWIPTTYCFRTVYYTILKKNHVSSYIEDSLTGKISLEIYDKYI